MIYHGSPLTVAEMQQKFEPLGIKVTEASIQKPNPYDGEVTVLGVTKREGMQAVEQYYGLSRADTIAFGDGANDLQMLEYAGIGVCMGDGAESAKARADLVTDALAEDGLLHAMERLGLV
ncbi:MAG: HAD-IIB family hydrolase [Lachnospiraceae bacterium]|nr:HAD-IIB family hydrolase [Lachnospiraceae bacterium]